MKCLSNLSRLSYPASLVTKLSRLYTFKGKDFYYEDVLKNYMPGIIKETIEKDTINCAKLLNLTVSDNRVRLIVKKDAEPKTKEEKILANLKQVFTIIQEKGTDLELTPNEFLHLATRIFEGYEDINYQVTTVIERVNLLDERKRVSKRESMEQLLGLYQKALQREQIEPTQVITNMYVDLLHSECYTDHNEFLALVIAYCLLCSERFNVFKYISFFEKYHNKLDEFNTATAASSFNYETGFSQTSMLNEALIQLMLDGYQEVEKMTDNFLFDKKLKKIDNVETAILKMPKVFNRETIKEACPHLSDSTINRALAKLKSEGKIRPNGTGRSATWVKLVPEEIFAPGSIQTNIFEYLKETDEN